MPPDNVFILTMILALATIDGVEQVSGLNPMIKWPNDLYMGRKKMGGILTEFSLSEKEIEYVVLGLGLNVNWNPGKGEEVLYPATSILGETGKTTSRNDLLVGILKSFEDYYKKALSGKIEDYYKRWNERSLVIGQEIEIESGGRMMHGTAIRIDRSGALIIENENGVDQKIISGDVSIKFGGS